MRLGLYRHTPPKILSNDLTWKEARAAELLRQPLRQSFPVDPRVGLLILINAKAEDSNSKQWSLLHDA